MQHTPIPPAERVSAPSPLPGTLPPAPAVMAILDRFNRVELGNAIEVLVALLDIWDGDPDNEPNGDDEPPEAEGDCRDAAYIEWEAMRGAAKRGPNIASDNEDDEESDPPEEDDPREDDDPPEDDDADTEHDGRELEQMRDDVPKLPVFTAEHNIFTDRRVPLGINE